MQSIRNILSIINDIFLKMTWLKEGVHWFLENVIGINPQTMLFESVSSRFLSMM